MIFRILGHLIHWTTAAALTHISVAIGDGWMRTTLVVTPARDKTASLFTAPITSGEDTHKLMLNLWKTIFWTETIWKDNFSTWKIDNETYFSGWIFHVRKLLFLNSFNFKTINKRTSNDGGQNSIILTHGKGGIVALLKIGEKKVTPIM